MGEIDEAEIVELIRNVMSKRRIKLIDIARNLDLPYGTLQNYVYGRSKMPLTVYLQICREIGLSSDYAVHGRFKLDHHVLQKSILDVLSPVIANLSFSDNMHLQCTPDKSPDKEEARRVAGILSTLIEHRYDTHMEVELEQPRHD